MFVHASKRTNSSQILPSFLVQCLVFVVISRISCFRVLYIKPTFRISFCCIHACNLTYHKHRTYVYYYARKYTHKYNIYPSMRGYVQYVHKYSLESECFRGTNWLGRLGQFVWCWCLFSNDLIPTNNWLMLKPWSICKKDLVELRKYWTRQMLLKYLALFSNHVHKTTRRRF